jgi:hypothetical protein
MRSLLILWLAMGFVRPAIAQWDGALKADMRLIAALEQVSSASHFSLDRMAGLAKRSGAQDNAPPGFYIARVTDNIAVSLQRGSVDTSDEMRRLSQARGRDA